MPLIVLEGIDGSGTTYHAARLVEALKRRTGETVIARKAPSDGPVGKLVRDIFECRTLPQLPSWLVMLHLFQADLEHQREMFTQELQEGHWVVFDRYWLSSLAYQVASAIQEGVSREVAEDLVFKLNEHMPEPDLTIILDVSVAEGLRRKKKDPDFYEQSDFLQGVKVRYDTVVGSKIRHIDTEKNTAGETEKQIDLLLQESGF